MEALLVIAVAVAAFVGFDLAAVGWGVDSRDAVTDDHIR